MQPRKQRKYRANAPLHRRHRFLSARLSPDLSTAFERRSLPVRKGDEIEVMRGGFRKRRGVVDRIGLQTGKIYVDGMTVKKVDGSEVLRPIDPSNVRIIRLKTEDKTRDAVLKRKKGPKKQKEPAGQTPKKAEMKAGATGERK